jgi:hypothetical protein
MVLDSKTLIVKSDNENELSLVIDFVSNKDKEKTIKKFLKFASENRKIAGNYKFNRKDCYDR